MLFEVQKLRTMLILFLFLLLYGGIALSLFFIQFFQGSFFGSLGHQQYTTEIATSPDRAEILDRHGNILAHSRESLSAFVLPQKCEDPDGLQGFLNNHFPLAAKRFSKKKDDCQFIYVKRRLSPAELQLIEDSKLADIKILKELSRHYNVPSAGPVVGLTDIDNNGLFGIEKTFNEQLAGRPTKVLLEKDARSGIFYFSKRFTETGKKGKSVTLTLDGDLQFLAREKLKDTVEQFSAESGAVLIIDPVTGDILTMAQFPDFDPNNTQELDIGTTRNKIVTDVYELGSVMKTFVALAAFQEGIVTPEEIIDCENRLTTILNGVPVNTVAEHGQIPFHEIIARSNNIGIAKIALRLGPALYEHYKRLGFGSLSNLGLVSEQRGAITHPNKWSNRSLFSLSYGYEISANLLQLGKAFCIIARNGLDITLRLVCDAPVNEQEPRILYSPEATSKIQDILRKTVEEGTAWRTRLDGYDILGKTGSADLYTHQGYDKDRSIFTFAGIIRKGNYQRVVVTFIHNVARKRLYAASVTVPLFRDIVEQMIIHDKQL